MLKEMILNRVVDINKILLNNYLKLNLNEREVLILMHIFLLMEKNKVNPSISSIKTKTNYNNSEISEVLNDLVKKNYLEIDFDSKTKKEIFNLSKLYDAIYKLFEEPNESFKSSNNEIKEMIELMQKELGRNLSANELEIIKHWAIENETLATIKEALIKANANGIISVKYVDSILAKKKQGRSNKNEVINAFYEAIK